MNIMSGDEGKSGNWFFMNDYKPDSTDGLIKRITS